jgi:peptidoglycan/LPS O-acetylase OafA/YrhL
LSTSTRDALGGTTVTGHERSELRADIQAMRAIAVAAVFAYHLAPERVPGGFTGVDVFFVISGFLITGNLIREADATGRIDVWRFWSRRMRRLLPASLLVLAVCAVATYMVVPGNLWRPFFREIAASTLYVQNWALAGDSVDYLAAENTPSPVQHYWTLSAEEQFYVVTPLLLVGLLVVAGWIHARRRVLLGGLATVAAASFAWSVWLTSSDPPAAYFVTTTRAWEFCAGALLLFAPLPRGRLAARLAVAGGVALVILASVVLSSSVPFPGAVAALPVLGAVALIWGGERPAGGGPDSPRSDRCATWATCRMPSTCGTGP